MAITARTTIDPNAMATAWATGVQSGGAKWIAGVKAPRRLPNANPAQNAANWIAGVTAAEPAFVAGISSAAYLPALEAGVTAKVGSYTGAATTKKANAVAGFTKVAPMIQTALASLPPRGPKGTNAARGAAFANAMHAQKGK